MKIDKFIGSTFNTPQGGVLTVLGCNNLKGSKKSYILCCSICSEDKELFPPYFESKKSNLNNGRVPCGCSKSCKWSMLQYETKVRRECSTRNYEFLGFGAGKGKRTKISLKCLEDDHVWETTSIDNFLHNGRGCTMCSRVSRVEALRLPDDTHIAGFLATKAYKMGTTFTRNTKRKTSEGYFSYWDITCPVCSEDVYVKEGLCSGRFTTHSYTLKRGGLPCRCSGNYKWTQEQREYQIKKLAKEEGLIFDNWVSLYTETCSKFNWTCKEGHKCQTTVDGFLVAGARCMSCYRESGDFGYFKDKKGDLDSLYLLQLSNASEDFIKIGRTFNLNNRVKQLSKFYGVSVITTNQGCHEDIHKTEQKYLKYLRGVGLRYKPRIPFGGDGECFTLEALRSIHID